MGLLFRILTSGSASRRRARERRREEREERKRVERFGRTGPVALLLLWVLGAPYIAFIGGESLVVALGAWTALCVGGAALVFALHRLFPSTPRVVAPPTPVALPEPSRVDLEDVEDDLAELKRRMGR